MNNSENKHVHLNEEKYQNTKKKINLVSLIVLIIGLAIGIYLIYNGVAKPKTAKLNEYKTVLETKKKELEDKEVVSSSNYSAGESYDLYIITKALDPSFDWCSFDEAKNNTLTKDYCSLKNSTGDFASTTSIMFGAFICIVTCMISFSIFMFAKRREILAFTTQQVMPIAKEGIDEIVPTIGKAAEEMAPTLGKVAGEITKGIKNGLKDDE